MNNVQRLLVLVPMMLALCGASTAIAQWAQVTGVPVADIPSLLIKGNTIYAATDSAVHISTDGGSGWTRSATLPGSPWFIDALTVFDGKIFAGTGGNGVFVSSNDGQAWSALSTGLSGPGSHHISSFAERNGVLYAGTGGAGVFRLVGSAWVPFGGLANNAAGSVWFLRTKGDTLIAGAGGSGWIWYAPAGATDWSGVQVAPLQGLEFLVTSLTEFGGALVVGSTYGIFRSTDNGASWIPSSSGLPAGRQISLVAGGGNLYAAAQSAATRFYTSSDGMNWTFIEQTMFSYAQAVNGNRLYAARLDGLWYKTIPTSGTEEPEVLPMRLELQQNYPNPFNPVTNIGFRIGEYGLVNLRIFDLLGREVAALVDEERPAGTYTASFDAAGLASGVYMYRLTAGGMSQTRRMMVVR